MTFLIPREHTLALDPTKVRDIRSDVLDGQGRLKILPAAYWAGTTMHERALCAVRAGVYCLPTVELVARLKELINGRSALEIGSGNGILAEALGITATDNYQQDMAKYREHYIATGQTPIKYGVNVQKMNAYRAVRDHAADVVIGCWVTHKWDPQWPGRGGNEIGINEEDVLQNCKEYILIGNSLVHKDKPIWLREHTIEYPSYMFSRSFHVDSREFIAVFKGSKV